MASDPYHSFAAELRSSLAATQQLSQRYDGLSHRGAGASGGSGSADEAQLRSTYEQLQESMEALENDIGDVRESVQMVEARGPERFGVDPAELARRKAFVRDCEREMEKLSASFRKAKQARTASAAAMDDDEDEDATLAFEMEQQEQLLSRQDNTLSLIGNTLTNLQRQAGTLGREIGEQVDLIGALDTEVDSSQNKLTRAMGRMDELARRADDRMGGWCVWILILALMVFALVAILI